MARRWWVKRTQILDTSVAHRFDERDSNVGRVQESRLYSTEAQARREAKAWEETGDWSTEVLFTDN